MDSASEQNQRKVFVKKSIEFLQVFISFSLLTALIYFLGGFHRPKQEHIICDAEQTHLYQGIPYFKSNTKHMISGAHLVSQEYSRSGKSSLRLDQKDKYGFTYVLPNAVGNEIFEANVWVLIPEGSRGSGAIACKAGDVYHEVQSKEIEGWQELKLIANLPISIRNEKVEIFCLHRGSGPIFLDDFNIQMTRVDK